MEQGAVSQKEVYVISLRHLHALDAEGDGRAGSCGACASLVLRLCGAPSERSCQRMMFAQPVTVRLDKLHEKKKEKEDALSHRDDADGRGPSTSTCGAPCRTSAHP